MDVVKDDEERDGTEDTEAAIDEAPVEGNSSNGTSDDG